jgi:hypothetical protein
LKLLTPSGLISSCNGLTVAPGLVSDGPKLIGVISIGDVVKQIGVDQNLVIPQLENYISGGRSPLPAYSKQ